MNGSRGAVTCLPAAAANPLRVDHLRSVGSSSPTCRDIAPRRPRTTPSLNIYRPPAARRAEGFKETEELSRNDDVTKTSPDAVSDAKGKASCSSKPRQRRPDIQVYVPRARRATDREPPQPATPPRCPVSPVPASNNVKSFVHPSPQQSDTPPRCPVSPVPAGNNVKFSVHPSPQQSDTPPRCPVSPVPASNNVKSSVHPSPQQFDTPPLCPVSPVPAGNYVKSSVHPSPKQSDTPPLCPVSPVPAGNYVKSSVHPSPQQSSTPSQCLVSPVPVSNSVKSSVSLSEVSKGKLVTDHKELMPTVSRKVCESDGDLKNGKKIVSRSSTPSQELRLSHSKDRLCCDIDSGKKECGDLSHTGCDEDYGRSKTNVCTEQNDVGKHENVASRKEQNTERVQETRRGTNYQTSVDVSERVEETLCENESDEISNSVKKTNRKNKCIGDRWLSEVIIISDPDPVIQMTPSCKDSDKCSSDSGHSRCETPIKKKKLKHKEVEKKGVKAESCGDTPSQTSEISFNDCSWEMLFDDNGDCLHPKLMEELTAAVGEVTIEKPESDYKSYQYKDLVMSDDEFAHVIEIYNFPSEFKTQDLMTVFSPFKNAGFEIKWVDDTHALGVFSSSLIAADVLSSEHPFVKTRPLNQATHESRVKARRSAEFLQPYRSRPETCVALARRLVSGALGVRLKQSREEREAERKLLKEAREKKKLAARQREDAWEGIIAEK